MAAESGPSPAPKPRKPVSTALLCLSALVPGLLVLGYDAASRWEIFVARAGPPLEGYFGGAAVSLALWAFVLEATRHPRRAVRIASYVILGFTGALGIGGQLLFRSVTHGYFNRDAALFSLGLWPTIFHYLALRPLAAAGILLGPAALAVGYGMARAHWIGRRGQLTAVMAGLAFASWAFPTFGPLRIPAQKHGLPPEVLFWHAAGGLALYGVGLLPRPKTLPPGQHTSPPPAERPAANDAPSIVLIFGESVRRDEVCAQKSSTCSKSPRVDAAAPDRVGFTHSFSVASCTEIASAILWTGLPIHSEAEAMQTTPLLWDYAKARGYRTAYLASQNLSFGGQGLFVRSSRIDLAREARDRDPHVDLDIGSDDEQTAAEALEFLAKDGPAFAVLHFSNTHLPYRQVAGQTPYEAEGDSGTARRARYMNSLVHQDVTIGDFIEKLRRSERGKKTIVVYHADHGEAWGEHDSYSHTFDLYAEQIDVPLWLDAPEGTLTAAQRAELTAGAQTRPVFTADVSATLLDLVGALDEAAFANLTKKLGGVSVLRPPPAQRDMELSNCPPFRSCFPEAWGIVRWPLKYHYVGRTYQSVCTDVRADPSEYSALPPDRCDEMRAAMTQQPSTRPDASGTPQPSSAPSPSAPAQTPVLPAGLQ